jgi:RND family efflux transporter MFP subunit
MKKISIFIVMIVCLSILFLIGYYPKYEKDKLLEKQYDKQDEIEVFILDLKPNTQSIPIVLPTYADAIHEVDIHSRVFGYVKDFTCDIGDFVTKDQLLLEIDTPLLDEELEKIKEDLGAKTALRDIALITKKRWEDLYKLNPEAVPYQEVQEKQAEFASQEASMLAAKRELLRFEARLAFKQILAPFDGIISQRNVDIGQLVDIGSEKQDIPLLRIIDPKVMRFFIDVPQEYFRSIKEGVDVSIKIPQYPEKNFHGTVTRFAKALDPQARTLLTQVNIENVEGLIYQGLYAEATLLLKPESVSFIIPAESLIIRSGPPVVAMVDDENKVVFKEVVIGRDFGRKIEIIDGLKESDKVIKAPYSKIIEGIKVKIKPSEK